MLIYGLLASLVYESIEQLTGCHSLLAFIVTVLLPEAAGVVLARSETLCSAGRMMF